MDRFALPNSNLRPDTHISDDEWRSSAFTGRRYWVSKSFLHKWEDTKQEQMAVRKNKQRNKQTTKPKDLSLPHVIAAEDY